MVIHFRFSLLLAFFALIAVFAAVSAEVLPKQYLGIPPQDEKYFKSDVIKCKDGSKKFPQEKLNDDFCDCSDGTDEPGTSACPEGKFYCKNAGHAPMTLFSSRVNDGICDCCDGSDEYDGKIKCPNTCWEAGKVARDKLKKKIVIYQDGVVMRKKEIEQAKEAIAKDDAELAKLKNEEKVLKGLVRQLKERKEEIEKAEEQERKEKEKEEQRKKEAEGKAIEQETVSTPDTHYQEARNIEDNPSESINQHGAEDISYPEVKVEHEKESIKEVSPTDRDIEDNESEEVLAIADEIHDTKNEPSPNSEEKKEKQGSDNTEGLSREELGRLVASRWTGESVNDQPDEAGDAAKDGVEHEAAPETDYEGYSSEVDGTSPKYGDDEVGNLDDEYEDEDEDPLASYKPEEEEDHSDFLDSTTPISSWLDKIQQTVKSLLQRVKLFTKPVDISDAARVRKEYDDSSSKLSQLQSKVSSLTKKLSHDYGPEKEFFSFYDRCFESKENKYIYKVCPFKEASQLEGHSTTRLGRWDKFEDSYRVMQFSSGDKCWNGPDRSLKVKLRCGLKNELTDVDEPSRCEYVAWLSTPAVCSEGRLMELQHKLDLLSKEQPQMHDEL